MFVYKIEDNKYLFDVTYNNKNVVILGKNILDRVYVIFCGFNNSIGFVSYDQEMEEEIVTYIS